MRLDEKMLITGLLDGLRPIPLLTVSEWSDKYRYLTTESSPEPGPWSTSRTPYLREIMDCLSPSVPVNDVIVAKGVQLGLTESGMNACGCYIDIDPCPIMYVMPTIELSKAISETRLDPMIENSPSLKKRVKPNRERDSGNTKLVKKFPGGFLVLSGANSAASLRSRPVKVLILDETDAYPLNVDNEGSPILLAVKRTNNFGSKKKIYKLSTPTIEGQSVIQNELDKTDKRYYFVPCPNCGVYQDLKFEQLKWEKGQYHTVKYECEACKHLIDERFKTRMLEHGEWKPTQAQMASPTKRGYHINSLYSPLGWLSWSQIVEEWEDAQGDDNKLRVFANTILGLAWKQQGEAPEWNNIYNRRETYHTNKPQKEICFITCGVDVQKDRLELEIVGWCKGKKSYSIDYRVIDGETINRSTWDKLAQVLDETWERADGMQMSITMMAIDTGYNTQYAYDFCRRFPTSRVIPVKGDDNAFQMIVPPRNIDINKKGKKIGKMKVWRVGVSVIKQELYGWLRLEKLEDGTVPPGYCFFPQYDPNYFKGLTAEELQFKMIKGHRKYEWVKKFERNEPLDCRVYARAAAAVVGIDRMKDETLDRMAGVVIKKTTDEPVKSQIKRKSRGRSTFWD